MQSKQQLDYIHALLHNLPAVVNLLKDWSNISKLDGPCSQLTSVSFRHPEFKRPVKVKLTLLNKSDIDSQQNARESLDGLTADPTKSCSVLPVTDYLFWLNNQLFTTQVLPVDVNGIYLWSAGQLGEMSYKRIDTFYCIYKFDEENYLEITVAEQFIEVDVGDLLYPDINGVNIILGGKR